MQQMPNSQNRLVTQWILQKWSCSAHQKWGRKPNDTLKGLVGNPKSLIPRNTQKFAWASCQKRWTNVKQIVKEKRNGVDKKVFVWNIKKGSQKLLRHLLPSKMNLHGKHPHLTWTHPRAKLHLNWCGRNKTKTWKVFKGVLTKGFELETKSPLVLALEKHVSFNVPPNHLLKTIIGVLVSL